MTKTTSPAGAGDKVDSILEQIAMLSPEEGTSVKLAIFEKFGVTPPPAVSSESTSAPTAEGEEKTEFTLMLLSVGPSKMETLKMVRELPHKPGLKEAKDLVDTLPAVLLAEVDKATASTWQVKFNTLGAETKIQ